MNKGMNKLIVSLVSAVVILLVIGCALSFYEKHRGEDQGIVYTNKMNTFHVVYPTSWTVSETEIPVVQKDGVTMSGSNIIFERSGYKVEIYVRPGEHRFESTGPTVVDAQKNTIYPKEVLPNTFFARNNVPPFPFNDLGYDYGRPISVYLVQKDSKKQYVYEDLLINYGGYYYFFQIFIANEPVLDKAGNKMPLPETLSETGLKILKEADDIMQSFTFIK